jgi:hypothetical protein
MTSDRWFEGLADVSDAEALEQRAPAKLTSRIYSTLVSELAASGPLLSLSATKEEGRRLCIFEDAIAALPIGERLKEKNPCRICHARVLAERLDRAPIFWPACPYSDFHKS